jgi:hypothetical protein
VGGRETFSRGFMLAKRWRAGARLRFSACAPTLRLMFSSPVGKRLLAAFLVAPLAAPVAYVIGTLAVEAFRRGSGLSRRGVLDLLIGVFALGAPTAYFAALVAGVPTYFVLRGLGLLTRWTVWLSGAAIGVAGALVLAPYLHGDLFSIRFPWWTAALLGIVSAEVFWRVRGGTPEGPA